MPKGTKPLPEPMFYHPWSYVPSTRFSHSVGLRPANERRRYKVTPSLIGWAQT